MIDINLKYQAVLFGSYEEIAPKPDIIKYFLEKFSDKELIPTTFQEIRPNGTINRFNLSSNDGMWLIEFSSTRIDIHKVNKNFGVTEIGSIDQFINEAKEIANIIELKFPKKHNRLSLVSRYLLPEMNIEEMSSIFLKLNNTIDLYKNNQIADWNNRTVSRINFNIGDNPELFNIISEIKRTIGNQNVNSKVEKIDRIELHFDINTYQGNTDYRFDLQLFNKFLDTASKIESDIKTSYLKLLEQ